MRAQIPPRARGGRRRRRVLCDRGPRSVSATSRSPRPPRLQRGHDHVTFTTSPSRGTALRHTAPGKRGLLLPACTAPLWAPHSLATMAGHDGGRRRARPSAPCSFRVTRGTPGEGERAPPWPRGQLAVPVTLCSQPQGGVTATRSAPSRQGKTREADRPRGSKGTPIATRAFH